MFVGLFSGVSKNPQAARSPLDNNSPPPGPPMPCLGLSLSVGVSVCCEVFLGLKKHQKKVGTHQVCYRGMIRKRLRNTLENGVVYCIHSNFGLFNLIKAHFGYNARKKMA